MAPASYFCEGARASTQKLPGFYLGEPKSLPDGTDLVGLEGQVRRFHALPQNGSRVTSDAGLHAYRELDDALGLTALAGDVLADSRTGKNGWHGVVGLLRQSVYGRLAGYEDVNDADRLGRDPAMRWIVGGQAVERGGASTSQMGRFETEL